MALTSKAISQFTFGGSSWDVRWDGGQGGVTGLGVRVFSSGRKAYVFSYRASGRKRLMTLGDCGAMTLVEARKRARAARVVVDDGGDPLHEKRKAAMGKTFGDLRRKYIDDYAKGHKVTWQTDERRFHLHVPKSWDARLASTITGGDVAGIHATVSQTAPYEANRLIEVLRRMFNLARTWDFPGFDDASKPNPAAGVPRNRERSRKRYVKTSEFKAVAQAIDREQNVYVRAAIWLFVLTGLRRSELLTARWDQVDWDARRLRLPQTKSGEEQSAALSSAALAILQATPRLDGNPFILPGAKAKQHLVNIAKPWDRIRIAAGIPDVRLHDLRRSVGSWMAQSGVDLAQIKDALRHANISTTLIYARLGEDSARDAFEAHGMRVMEIAGRRKVADG